MRFDAFTAGGSNTLASIAASSERCVNWFPEPISGNQEKGPMALTRTPGLSLFATLPQTPLRGLFPGDGALYAVGGAHLYQVFADGTYVDRSTPGFTGASGIGTAGSTIGNDGLPVQMFANGNQLLVISAGAAYCDNGNGPVLCQFSIQLTDMFIDPDTGGLTSGTGGFDSSDVGNSIQITSGSGFTIQTQIVTSVVNGEAFGSAPWGVYGLPGGLVNYTDLSLLLPFTVGSASHPFTQRDVGLILTITGGTGFTPGTYMINQLMVGADGLPNGFAILGTPTGALAPGSLTTFTDLSLLLPYLAGSASQPFTQYDVGQILTITGGTGFTPGTYMINQLMVGADGVPNGFAILGTPTGGALASAGVAGSTGGEGSITPLANTSLANAGAPDSTGGIGSLMELSTGAPATGGMGIEWFGTDYYTDLFILGAPFLVGSTSKQFTAAAVGKTLHITGGTGFTSGAYLVQGLMLGPTGQPNGCAILAAAAGTPGSTGGAGYIDEQWVNASKGAYLDSYFFVSVYPAGKLIYFSAPGDGTQWNPLDYFDKEAYPDNVAAMQADHEQLYVFGDLEASEVFQDQGATNPLVPWAPNPGAIMHYGCVAPWSLCRLGEGLAWIGGDVRRGDRVAFLEVGFRPQKISTAAVETAWAGYSTVEDAIAYTCIDRGHQFWCINFPTGNATWVYDLTTGLWHERGYWAGTFDANGFPVWGMQLQQFHAVVALTTTEQHFVGGLQSGKIYIQSEAYKDDSGVAIYRMRRSPHVTTENLWRFYSRFELDCDVTAKQRIYWNRCGKGRDRIWQVVSHQTASAGVTLSLSWSDTRAQTWLTRSTQTLAVGVDVTLANAYIEAIQGTG